MRNASDLTDGVAILALQLNRSGKDTSAASKSGTGKPATAAPVTAHPLFPAVVALWFGALFGLGSLAVRVGLIEALVLATQIDTLIPAAAPPLGISARILLALSLATLGALLGAAIARRIAAPKPVVRERKRKAALSPDETVNLRSRDAHPDAPARRPLSINDALSDAPPEASSIAAQAAGDPLAGRRRSALAIETDATFELHELAPLPGSDQHSQPFSSAVAAPDAHAPLELGAYAEANEGRLAVPSAGPALDWHNAASSAVPATAAPQVFHADHQAGADLRPNFSPPSDAATGRQVFGMTHPQPDEVLDELGITDAEFEPLPAADMRLDAPSDSRFGAVDLAATAAFSVPVAAAEPIPAEAADADPATLPMTDLANRLAESMQRRRERTARSTGRAADAAVAAAAAPSLVAAVAVPTGAALAAIGEPEPSPPRGFDQLSAVAAPGAVPDFAHPNQIPGLPVAALPSLAQSLPQTGLNFTAAPAAQPVLADAMLPDPHRPLFGKRDSAVPAGLRPLSFEALADDDDRDDFATGLPPRSFPGVGAFQAPTNSALNPFAGEAAAGEGEPAADAKFSSLLDLNRSAEPRQSFVRIEAADEPVAAIEPVVIFPGQLSRIAAADAASPPALAQVPVGFDAAQSFRQFDSPASADAGQAVAAVASAPHDPAETERALRAALANLQRMSGAA